MHLNLDIQCIQTIHITKTLQNKCNLMKKNEYSKAMKFNITAINNF